LAVPNLLRFFVGLGRVGTGSISMPARESGFGGALALFFGGLDGAGDLGNADLHERQQRSTTRRCEMTDLNSL
jgi:hypothetical protein